MSQTPWTTSTLLVTLALGACHHAPPESLLVSREECVHPAASMMSRRGAIEDMALLESILREGYAGWEPLAAQGLDWEVLLARMRASVEALPEELPVEDLRLALLHGLEGINDGHLALYTVTPKGWRYKAIGRHSEAFRAELTLGRAAGAWTLLGQGTVGEPPLFVGCEPLPAERVATPFLAAVDPPILEFFPVIRASASPTLACQTAAGLRTPSWAQVNLPLPINEVVRAYTLEQREVPILRIRTFSATAQEYEGFADSATRLRDAPVVLVDLRGNPGGSDAWARDWYLALSDTLFRYPAIHELRSTITHKGDLNRQACSGAQPEHALPPLLREWNLSEQLTFKGQAPSPFQGRLLLLTDSDCASACESFVRFGRQLPGTIVYGEPTAGVSTFGETRAYRLPNSGIWVQAGKKWFREEDPRLLIPEGLGIRPDLWHLDGDPLEKALGLARCLADASCAARVEGELQKATISQ